MGWRREFPETASNESTSNTTLCQRQSHDHSEADQRILCSSDHVGKPQPEVLQGQPVLGARRIRGGSGQTNYNEHTTTCKLTDRSHGHGKHCQGRDQSSEFSRWSLNDRRILWALSSSLPSMTTCKEDPSPSCNSKESVSCFWQKEMVFCADEMRIRPGLSVALGSDMTGRTTFPIQNLLPSILRHGSRQI